MDAGGEGGGRGAWLADAVFVRGAAHAVCEDYAAAGPLAGTELAAGTELGALVADGCSSAAESDIAARLAWLAFRRSGGRAADFPQAWAAQCAAAGVPGYSTALGLRLVAGTELGTAPGAELIEGYLAGDGFLAVGGLDGRVWLCRLAWPRWNAPLYGAYLADPDVRRRWELELPGNELAIEWAAGAAGTGLAAGTELGAVAVADANQAPDGFPGRLRVQPDGTVLVALDAGMVDWALVASDGLDSFRRSDGAELAAGAALAVLAALRNRAPGCLRRRVVRGLDELAAQGWRHLDDLGLAMLARAGEVDDG